MGTVPKDAMRGGNDMRKMKRSRFAKMILVSLYVLGTLVCGTSFAAQEDFPKKEITIICNMAAGGGRDLLSRGIGKTMSKYLKVPVVVMNVTGANGVLGITKIYHSAPDGYTIGAVTMSDIFNQLFEKTDYDVKKLVHIGRADSSPCFLYVQSDSPFRSVKDLKTYGKPIRYSAFSYGSQNTIVAMVLAHRDGWPLKIIGGYKGAAPALLDLIRGNVDLSGSKLPDAKEHIRAGKVRPLVLIDRKRIPDFPELQTVGEIGYPDLENFTVDTEFVAPPGVPKDRVKILEDALLKTVRDPEFVEWAKGAAINPAWMGGEEYTKLVYELFEVFGKYKGIIQKYIE